MSDNTKEILTQVEGTLEEYRDKMENRVKEILAEGQTDNQTAVDELKKEIGKIDESLTQVQQQIKTIGQPSVPGAEKEIKNFSLQALVKGMYNEANHVRNPWEGCEVEKELCEEYAKTRSNYAADGSAGGYLIPNEYSQKIIELVYANTPILSQLPVTKLTGLTGGDFHIPKLTTAATAYMVGELAQPTATEVAYGEIIARERRVAAFTKQSKRLIYQSRGVSDEIIKREIARAMSIKMHDMMLNGKGGEYEPKGLTKYTGDMTSSTAIGTNGGRFTITNAALMQMALEVANEGNDNPANYGFLMRPEAKFGLKTERVEQYSGQAQAKGAPVLPVYGVLPDAVIKEIVGNFATTTQLSAALTKGNSSTCSQVFYGNWNYFWTMFWEGMSIRVSDQAYDGTTSAFTQNQMFIIAEQGFDVALTRGSAFTYIADAETTASSW